jgi:hypothetical protein
MEDINDSSIFRPTLMDHINDLFNETTSTFDIGKPPRNKWMSPF